MEIASYLYAVSFFFNQPDCSIARTYLALIMYLHMQILRENLAVRNIVETPRKMARVSHTQADENIVYVAGKPTASPVLGGNDAARETEADSLSTRTMQLAKCQEHYSLHIVNVADIRTTNMRD